MSQLFIEENFVLRLIDSLKEIYSIRWKEVKKQQEIKAQWVKPTSVDVYV